MRGPLVILAVLSVCGGWIGMSISALSLRLPRRAATETGQFSSGTDLSVVAVLVAMKAG